jgi:carbon monoxide dehydrogenase subunit G
MILQGERVIPASQERTWAALNDPEVLKACMQGCEVLERIGDNQFQAVMAVRIGPVSAKFKGKLEMTDIQVPNAYTIHFEGQGGLAGFGKGSAFVQLTPEGQSTLLAYKAEAKVGGKIAQIGSRLVDTAAAKITDDFFSAFMQHFVDSSALAPELLPSTSIAPMNGSGSAKWWWVLALVLGCIALWFWGVRN